MPTWTAEASYEPGQPLSIRVSDLPLERALIEDTPCPVDYLLISIAACYALSLAAALKRAGLPLQAIRVAASGWRSVRPAARVERIELHVTCVGLDRSDKKEAILADAKRICTVSNSLSMTPGLDILLAGQ
jgi:uncharacterized OsmC-like protein